MTSAQVVKTSVKVTPNSPSQDYSHPDDHNLRTYNVFVFIKRILVLSFEHFDKSFRKPKGSCFMLSFSSKAVVREADWFVFKFTNSLKYRSLGLSESKSGQLPSTKVAIFCSIVVQLAVSFSFLYAELCNTVWDKTMLL